MTLLLSAVCLVAVYIIWKQLVRIGQLEEELENLDRLLRIHRQQRKL